jgi:predicted permease
VARDARRAHWSTRAFRALLSLYPGEFRDEYGREMAMVFADRYRDAPNAFERALVWLEAVSGVLKEAPKEHVLMILQDLRYAARILRRSPALTATAVLTLALGIGANTAVFQLINAVGMRSLPVEDPGALAEVRIAGGNKGFGITNGRYGQLTRPVWQELQAHQEAFSGVFAWGEREVRVGEGSDLRRARGLTVSGEFFRVLGVQAFRGRLFEPSDEASSCPSRQAVISHAYWQRELGGRELGRDARLTVDLQPQEIIGVTPPGFFGLAVGESFDIAFPFCRPEKVRREVFDLAVMGRLRPGWTIERASAHLDALSTGIFEAAAPTGYGPTSIEQFKKFRLAAYSGSAGVSWLRAQYDMPLQLLLAMTGLVLLIACANLANLMLARATARQHEVAVRLALGASRATLLRQFLVESGLLAASGAALGIGLAQILSRVLVRTLSTADAAPTLTIATDWRVLLFTAGLAMATCLVFGIAPALRAARILPASAMKSGGRSMTAGRERFSVQRLMVVTQIAVSLVLLVAALLFVRSFRNLITFDPGFRQEGITVGFFSFHRSGLAPEGINDFQRAFLAEIKAVPGIVNAGTTTNTPLIGGSWTHGVQVGANQGDSKFTWVSPGYFETMNLPILQGRDFTLHDTRTSPRVAVVNQTFVRQLVGGYNPIGRTLRTAPEPNYPSTVYEIVGVVPDTKYNDLRGQIPAMAFAPDSQYPTIGPWSAMMIQSSVEPAVAIAGIKHRLAESHPEILAEFSVFQSRIRAGLLRERLLAMLSGFFGALAAVLAVVGLYGMISFAVAQRRQEIGIRVALGAGRPQVIGMMMREAGWLLAVGLAVGAGLSLIAGRTASTLLFGLKPHDPLTLVSACLLLAVVAAAASFVPARSASKLDPLAALRHE